MSRPPLRSELNCALTFISDEPGYTVAFSVPLLRLASSLAKRRQSRSRKSPSVSDPPGNWCEILRFVGSAAKTARPGNIVTGKLASPARRLRRVVFIDPSRLFDQCTTHETARPARAHESAS